MALIKPFISDFEVASLIAVSVHVLLSTFLLITRKNKYRYLFLVAFFSRIFIMFWDLYARSILVLTHSGADSERFYYLALSISNNISLFTTVTGMYQRLMGLLFYLIGPQRMTAQYLNVLLGLSTVVIIWRILELLNINQEVIRKIVLLATFFPTSMIVSGIFLREILPTFFVALSLFQFVKWFKTESFFHAFVSVLFLLIASAFHSGVIAIFVGYSFGFLFYKRKINAFRSSVKTILVFFLIVIGTMFLFTRFSYLFFAKFGDVDSIEDIYNKASRSGGGAAYLGGLSINSIQELIAFGPLKAFYFLASPLPMNWRGPADIISFMTDSILYLTTIFWAIRYRKKLGNSKSLLTILLIAIIGAAIVFGIGVGNAGTAMRHRQKLIPVFLVIMALVINNKEERFNAGVRDFEY